MQVAQSITAGRSMWRKAKRTSLFSTRSDGYELLVTFLTVLHDLDIISNGAVHEALRMVQR